MRACTCVHVLCVQGALVRQCVGEGGGGGRGAASQYTIIMYVQCSRSVRRVGDMRRHKCDSIRSRERREPPRGVLIRTGPAVVDENTSTHNSCRRVFRRADDMKRHRCGSVRDIGG